MKFALASDLLVTNYLNFTDSKFILTTIILAFNIVIEILSNYFAGEGNGSRTLKTEKLVKIIVPVFSFSMFSLFYMYFFGN